VNDIAEARELGKYMTGEKPTASFYDEFKGRYSEGFDISKDLERIGVVNQTTQLGYRYTGNCRIPETGYQTTLSIR
jgi:4-hydroxy-3-methylbut-2-enyl diphosphate reductase